MATNYGLCIVIASLSIVTVMVRGCAWWCRGWGIGSREGWGCWGGWKSDLLLLRCISAFVEFPWRCWFTSFGGHFFI